jgi:hypothetical protein
MKKASLQFHIEANDYFGTLVLDLVSQDLRKKGHRSSAKTLRRLPDDLVYLQDRYHIRRGEQTPLATSRGRVTTHRTTPKEEDSWHVTS